MVKSDFSFENPSLNQIKIIRCITKYLKDTAYYLSTTGLCSRILYNANHTNNIFYMQGSMGCVSPIAVGLDFLMKMGNVAIIAHYWNQNLVRSTAL